MEVSIAVWGCQNGTREQDARLAQVAGPGWAEQSGKSLPAEAFTVNKKWGMVQVTAPTESSAGGAPGPGSWHDPGIEKPGLFWNPGSLSNLSFISATSKSHVCRRETQEEVFAPASGLETKTRQKVLGQLSEGSQTSASF